MRAVNAQAIGRTYDCITGGCHGDADEPGAECDNCKRVGGSKRLALLSTPPRHVLNEIRRQPRDRRARTHPDT